MRTRSRTALALAASSAHRDSCTPPWGASARERERASMRSRLGHGRTGSPVRRGACRQHEQRHEHRNGDERNGRDEQHGGRDQKHRGQREKNCSERQGYSESKNGISFLHAAFERAIIWPAAQADMWSSIEILFAQNEVHINQFDRARRRRTCGRQILDRSSGASRAPTHRTRGIPMSINSESLAGRSHPRARTYFYPDPARIAAREAGDDPAHGTSERPK